MREFAASHDTDDTNAVADLERGFTSRDAILQYLASRHNRDEDDHDYDDDDDNDNDSFTAPNDGAVERDVFAYLSSIPSTLLAPLGKPSCRRGSAFQFVENPTYTTALVNWVYSLLNASDLQDNVSSHASVAEKRLVDDYLFFLQLYKTDHAISSPVTTPNFEKGFKSGIGNVWMATRMKIVDDDDENDDDDDDEIESSQRGGGSSRMGRYSDDWRRRMRRNRALDSEYDSFLDTYRGTSSRKRKSLSLTKTRLSQSTAKASDTPTTWFQELFKPFIKWFNSDYNRATTVPGEESLFYKFPVINHAAFLISKPSQSPSRNRVSVSKNIKNTSSRTERSKPHGRHRRTRRKLTSIKKENK